jgi:hypothetical protein
MAQRRRGGGRRASYRDARSHVGRPASVTKTAAGNQEGRGQPSAMSLASVDWLYWLAIAACLAFMVACIVSFVTLAPRDTAENSKVLSLTIAFSVVASILLYGLAAFYFAANPRYLAHFLLAFEFLVLLPAGLTSLGVATVAASSVASG